MSHKLPLHRWTLALACGIGVLGLVGPTWAAAPTELPRTAILFSLHEAGTAPTAEGTQVINALAGRFKDRGYTVLAEEGSKPSTVQPVARIEVSVQARTVSRKVDGEAFEVHKVTATAKAAMDCTGDLLAAATATASKPFDLSGALEAAAGELADKLLADAGRTLLDRDRTDYRLAILDPAAGQADKLRDALLRQKGVLQASQCGPVGDASVLAVHVKSGQGPAFEKLILTGLSGIGFPRLDVVSREGGVVFLQGATALAPAATATSPKPTEYKEGYDHSWAVVIGIDRYKHWPALAYAVSDAKKIRESLKPLGFDLVTLLVDQEATKKEILDTLGTALRTKTRPNDRVLVFFAGHGYSEMRPDGSRQGYIVPSDGDPRDTSSYISMETLQDLADEVPAKHFFYVMDSCFSGGLARVRGEMGPAPIFTSESARRDVLAKTRFPVRQVLTCGGAGEQVVELNNHGVCTNVILDGLAGGADLDRDGYILANELSRFAAVRVEEASRGLQHPQFGYLLARADRLGDFVLKLGPQAN